MKIPFATLGLSLVLSAYALAAPPSAIPKSYTGTPYQSPQAIPGRVELAHYDRGGEGVAYHDTTPANEGAKLNRTPGHWRPGVPAEVAFFREDEAVDISYTKDWADYNHPNRVDPKVNQLYIGWEDDGEWTNYTIHAAKPGVYQIITVYGYADNRSELWLNGQKALQLQLPENTGNFHHWTQARPGKLVIPQAGLHLLTLKYNKGANLAYLDFLLVEEHGPDGKPVKNPG
jgi:hypothetical protein